MNLLFPSGRSEARIDRGQAEANPPGVDRLNVPGLGDLHRHRVHVAPGTHEGAGLVEAARAHQAMPM